MNRTGRNALFSAGVRMENGALGKKFDAYPQRHPVTESSYNNSLADRHIWSTIKTSPATLPEPRSEARGPRSAFHGSPPSSHGPGLMEPFICQIWTWLKGVGPQDAGACASDRRFTWLVGGGDGVDLHTILATLSLYLVTKHLSVWFFIAVDLRIVRRSFIITQTGCCTLFSSIALAGGSVQSF